MINGKIQKTAAIGALTATDEELAKVNAFALNELSADDVYLFKIGVCSNAQDTDRDNEPLLRNAVSQLAERLKGRTIIFDHMPSAKNQVARIYGTELETVDEQTEAGEQLTKLTAHCYMVKTATNADLIAEIRAGIKKEVSVGFSTGRIACNICGKDFDRCPHRKGHVYSGKTCRAQITDCTDAYEVSFVAVPCQIDAGTKKAYTPDDSDREKSLRARIRLNEILFKEE